MRYPYVLMDADETLLDFKRSERTALARALAPLGIEVGPEDAAAYSAINDGLWKRLERGEIAKPRLMTARFEVFLARWGLEADPERVNADYLEALASSAFALPGARELCGRLRRRGHRLYLVTNGTARAQRGRLGLLDMLGCFDSLFISDEIGAQKPDPAFFQAVFTALGHPPKDQMILLGDSLTSDMRGGRLAGIATCWYNPGGGAPSADCDYTVSALDQFDAIALGAGAP